MSLTAYTDYALRVLMHRAFRPEPLTMIADIAKGYGISENHLTKLVHQLGLAGFIDTSVAETASCVCASRCRDQRRPEEAV